MWLFLIAVTAALALSQWPAKSRHKVAAFPPCFLSERQLPPWRLDSRFLKISRHDREFNGIDTAVSPNDSRRPHSHRRYQHAV